MFLKKKKGGGRQFISVCHYRLLSKINLEELQLFSQFWKRDDFI